MRENIQTGEYKFRPKMNTENVKFPMTYACNRTQAKLHDRSEQRPPTLDMKWVMLASKFLSTTILSFGRLILRLMRFLYM